MVHNRQQLTDLIEQTIQDKNISVLDALIDIQERFNIEEEVIAAFVRQSHKLKDLLKQEAISLKLVKNDSI